EERTWLVANGANLSQICPASPRSDVRAELGAGQNDILFVYAGNLGETQGLEEVLDVANVLRQETRIRFAFVGTGAARARLERRARDLRLNNTRFLPVQPEARLSSLLAAADVHLVVQRRRSADLMMPSKL